MQRTREKELELLESFPEEKIQRIPPNSPSWVRPKQRWSFRHKALIDTTTNNPIDKESLS